MSDVEQNMRVTSDASLIGVSQTSGACITAFSESPIQYVIMRGDGTGPLVTISPDGMLEFGEGYTPDEAAEAFWRAMAKKSPRRIREETIEECAKIADERYEEYPNSDFGDGRAMTAEYISDHIRALKAKE